MSNAGIRELSIAYGCLVLLCSCSEPVSESTSPALPSGYWQASITLPGGNIETGFEVSNDDGTYGASLINGQERVRIGEVSFSDGELLLRFPAFNNHIRATLLDGKLQGELTIVGRLGETQTMPFLAAPGGAPAHESEDSPQHDLSGRWQMRFNEADGSTSPAIGEFAQRGSRLFGTILTPNGDHRYLAGHVSGDRFDLSTFDGAHAFLFSGNIGADASIHNADFWSATSWHQSWSAERNEAIELPDAYERTFLKPGYEKFEFEFPDPDGQPVSLADEKFAGKVVLVTIAGTWCPNCNDEARLMATLHQE